MAQIATKSTKLKNLTLTIIIPKGVTWVENPLYFRVFSVAKEN